MAFVALCTGVATHLERLGVDASERVDEQVALDDGRADEDHGEEDGQRRDEVHEPHEPRGAGLLDVLADVGDDEGRQVQAVRHQQQVLCRLEESVLGRGEAAQRPQLLRLHVDRVVVVVALAQRDDAVVRALELVALVLDGTAPSHTDDTTTSKASVSTRQPRKHRLLHALRHA